MTAAIVPFGCGLSVGDALPRQCASVLAVTPDEQLDQLEDALRKLGTDFEIFFNGGSRRAPTDSQWRVDNLFRILNEATKLNYAQRFRVAQLQQRYSMLAQVWRRRMAVKEQGATRAADRCLTVAGAGESLQSKAKEERSVVLGYDPEVDAANIDRLYSAFLKARERAENPPPAGTAERFRQFIHAKAAALTAASGEGRVVARVLLDGGQVRLVITQNSPQRQ